MGKAQNKNLKNNSMNDQIITQIQSNIPASNESRENVTKWLKSTKDIYRTGPSNAPFRHIVVYCVLIDPIVEKILLLGHKKSGKLLPAGGHVDIGEDPLHTSVRELYEETGVREQSLLSHPMSKKLTHLSITKISGELAHEDVNLYYLFCIDSKCNDINPQKYAPHYEEEFTSFDWYDIKTVIEDQTLNTLPEIRDFCQIVSDNL